MNGPTWLRALLVLSALGGCASNDDSENQEAAAGPARRKQRMLLGTERAIFTVIDDSHRDAVALQREFQAQMESSPRTFRLSTSDPVLVNFDEAARQARRDLIEQEKSVAEAKMNLLLEHYETALWAVATRAGELEHGNDLGTRTGYQELDDKVEAALLQLARIADPHEIAHATTLRIYDDVVLDRVFRHEIEKVGVLSLFKSAPTLGLFAPRQEGQAIVISFLRDGIPTEVPLSFVQAVRRRVERGGIVLTATQWQADPATPGGTGIVPLRADLGDPNRIATDICIPSVDTQLESFRDLQDRVLISEYRTALRRDDTGELIRTIGWQVRWNVDFHGLMRVLVDKRDIIVEGDTVLPSLAAALPKN